MDSEIKKAVILLKSLIFHYHGMDMDEQKILLGYVEKLEAKSEYDWAIAFIAQDYLSAYNRSREYFLKTLSRISDAEKVQYLHETWNDNHRKGYVTEMETTAMMSIAKDLGVDKQFLIRINQD